MGLIKRNQYYHVLTEYIKSRMGFSYEKIAERVIKGFSEEEKESKKLM